MLQHLQSIPGIQNDDCPQHWRKVFGFRKHHAPLAAPLGLIRVEIVDQRILLPLASLPGRTHVRDHSLGAGKHPVDRRELRSQRVSVLAPLTGLPFPSQCRAAGR